MTNINPFQFTNSFINGYNTARTANAQNNTVLQNGQNENAVLNQPSQTILPKTMQQLSQTTAELAMLDNQQTIDMLKQLLNMPKNFEQLLSQLTSSKDGINQSLGLLLLAANTDLSALSNLLKNNSKEAMTNLYQMLAQYNKIGMNLKDELISDITKYISFVAASSNNDVQTLKAAILMYLPWLPLTDPNAFKLEIGNKGGSDDNAGDDYISILITTVNYGNLQADVYKTAQDGIKIQLISSQTFPQKEFTVLMQEESKKYSININFELAVKESFNKEKAEKSNTQIYMNTSPGVNPFLLLISNALIKNVHIIDSKEDLREKRKGMLINGET